MPGKVERTEVKIFDSVKTSKKQEYVVQGKEKRSIDAKIEGLSLTRGLQRTASVCLGR